MASKQKHPDITVAFDIAKAALTKAIHAPGELTVSDMTKQMLKAVMDAGFVIVHRDEMQEAILVSAKVGKILDAPAERQL